MLRRRVTFTAFLGLVAVTAAACLPHSPGEPPPTTTTTTSLATGSFSESEPNNSSATATVVPPAGPEFTLVGSQNDGDDPASGDTDYFRLTATSDGTLSVTCDAGEQVPGTTLSVINSSNGDTDVTLCPGTATVNVSDGDTVLVRFRTLEGASGFSYGLVVNNP